MDRGAEKRRQSALKIDLKSTNGLYMTTVNPCNDFLVDFLIASKLKSEKQGIGKFTTYNLAIQSVRKYPLPIICEAQLAALEGFGDFFINQAAKRIQKHYKRGRLPNQQQILQDDEQHFHALQANRRKGYRKRKNSEQDEEQNQGGSQEEQRQDQKQEEKSKQRSKSESSQHKKTGSVVSSKRAKNLERYKPRPDSEPWKILKAMYILNARNKAIAKGQINQIFYNWPQGEINVKSWQNCKTRLKECGYIESDKKQKDLFKLTEKGYNFILQQLGPQAKKQKQKIVNKLEEDSNKVFKVSQDGKLKLVECQNGQLLTLIIKKQLQNDIKQNQEFIDLLTYKGIHKYRYEQNEVGTFMWQIYGKLLDYTVIRYVKKHGKFNKDKLVNDCKFTRLCQCTHVTVIFEDQEIQQNEQQQNQQKNSQQNQNQDSAQDQKQYENTLLNCRAGGFRILKFKSFEQTIRYIEEITTILKQKLKKLAQIKGINIIGTIQSANKKIMQSKMQAKLYSRCLRLFGINKIATERLTRLFGTFKLTQQKMRQKFKDLQVRKQFLKKTLGEFEVTDDQIDNILNFFYSSRYL